MDDPTETQEYKDLQRTCAELNKSLRKLENDYNRLGGLVGELLRRAEWDGARYCVGRKPVDDLRKALSKQS